MEEVTPHAGAEEARPPSAREIELLALVARGMSNREIAEALVLAESTVKRHLANAYEKLGVHSRSGLWTRPCARGCSLRRRCGAVGIIRGTAAKHRGAAAR